MRPNLSTSLTSSALKDFYYLKEELVIFCKDNGLQTSGSKQELIERISSFLEIGIKTKKTKTTKTQTKMNNITVETIIEENIRCSEIHRAFFEKEIGKKFSFNASFQRWLKENAGKQYLKAIEVWYEFQSQKKKNESKIDSQFEYNTYIRDFFKANQGSKLSEYKKALPGTNKYEEKDLLALSNEE